MVVFHQYGRKNAFSVARQLDLAVQFFVEKGVGDLDKVNNVLYELGMETLP